MKKIFLLIFLSSFFAQSKNLSGKIFPPDTCNVASCRGFNDPQKQQIHNELSRLLWSIGTYTASADSCNPPSCKGFKDWDLQQIYAKIVLLRQALINSSGSSVVSAVAPLSITSGTISLKTSTGLTVTSNSLAVDTANTITSKLYTTAKLNGKQNTLSGTGFIYQSGSTTSYTNSIPNSSLANSTISGVSLGGNLFNHSVGYGLSGSNYNGSTSQSWTTDTTVVESKLYGAAKYQPKLTGSTSQLLTAGGSTVVIGSNLTLSSGTLSATSGGSGTISTSTIGLVGVYTGTNTISGLNSSPVFSVSTTPSKKSLYFGNNGSPNLNSTSGDPRHMFELTYDGNLDTMYCMRINTYGTNALGSQNNFHWCRYRGTIASPSAVQSGDFFMSMGFRGWYGSAVSLSGSAAAHQCVATENWSDGSHNGCAFLWQVTPNGSGWASRAQALTLNGLGQLIVSTNTTTFGGNNQAIDIARNGNGYYASIWQGNTSNGNAAATGLYQHNDLGNATHIMTTGSGYTPSGAFKSDGCIMYNNGAGGINFATTNASGTIGFYTNGTASGNGAMNINASQRVYFGSASTSATANIHIKAGTATASTAPLKFTSGTNLTTPEDGAVEYDGTNYFVTNSTATRYTVTKVLTTTGTLDFPSTSASTNSDLTITVTGAALNDAVTIGVPNGSVLSNSCFTGFVSSSNTVTIRFNNYDPLNSKDPASGTFRVAVEKY